MSFSAADPIIATWAQRHGLNVPTHDDAGAELNFRNVYTSVGAECCQIWIEQPEAGIVVVHAASVESRDDAEVERQWRVPLPELGGALETALSFVRTWMGRQL